VIAKEGYVPGTVIFKNGNVTNVTLGELMKKWK